MSYEITLNITEDSPQAQNIDATAENEHISREEAALQLLAQPARKRAAIAETRQILGLFSAPEDAALMDEVMELIAADRERQNAESPRG